MVSDMIRLFKVFMSNEAPKLVSDVLLSGYIGEGKKVAEFENQLGELLDNENVLAVNSGTSALMLALMVAGIGNGDFVVSTPMTCLATNEAILATGAEIVWADVDPKTGLIDPVSIEDVLNHNAIDAIMCMHWGGGVCNLSGINDAAKQPYETIPVIEDACQALGSMYNDKPMGHSSRFTCFSFQAIKTLTTADGGAIVFRDEKDLERAKLMKWFGLDRSISSDMRCNQDPVELGYKMQMNDVAAAIGLCNIKHLLKLLDRMYQIATSYSSIEFKNVDNNHVIPSTSSNWLYTVPVDDAADFIAYMRNKGVECSKVHDRNDTKIIFKDARTPPDGLPGVEEFNCRHVCIPCGWWLTDEEVETIIEALRSY